MSAELPPELLEKKVRPPVAIVLGSPAKTADLVEELGVPGVVCYQLDLYQADRLREEIAARELDGQVVTAADLWDLPEPLQTVLYSPQAGGERSLKIDMIEQAFHVLRPRGTFLVLSPYDKENFFPPALKKVFGKVHAPLTEAGQVFWCTRDGERPRRRHEINFHVRAGDGTSLNFLSRPGVFAYGRFDEGARALVETMHIEPGDRILDVGCGCGTNGILAARRGGPDARVVFVDSNVRALALAELNARANGIEGFEIVASSRIENVPGGPFDVALANPPYYAAGTIAKLFVARSRALLRPGGRFYLVTKQPSQLAEALAEAFSNAEAVHRRGYTVISAVAEK